MSINTSFRSLLDLPDSRLLANVPVVQLAGMSYASDLRSHGWADPNNFFVASNTLLYAYSPANDGWQQLASPVLPVALAAGATSVFVPSAGPRSRLLAGSTDSALVTDGLMDDCPAVVTGGTRSGTTATFTTTRNHGFSGNATQGTVIRVTVSNSEAAVPLQNYVVQSTPAANQFTITVPNAGLTSGINITMGRAVGPNMLANRGDGRGYRIRVIGLTAGKVEERWITGNTAGAAPTIYLDTPLSFTPAAGDKFEILSGRLFLLTNGTTGTGYWKYYDVATDYMGGFLTTTNLPATINTDSSLVALDEQYNQHDTEPGLGLAGIRELASVEGVKFSDGEMPRAEMLQYHNCQIRIVEDLTNPSSVGQRSLIYGIDGPTDNFLIYPFSVVPAVGAKFVIELGNQIIGWTSASVTTYSYGGYVSDVLQGWSNSAFFARPNIAGSAAGMGAGCSSWTTHGLVDPNGMLRPTCIVSFRGGNTTHMSVLDTGAATNGNWLRFETPDVKYWGAGSVALTTGWSAVYDPVGDGGRYSYIFNGATALYRFDNLTMTLMPYCQLKQSASTAVVGQKITAAWHVDGSDTLTFLYTIGNSVAIHNNIMVIPET